MINSGGVVKAPWNEEQQALIRSHQQGYSNLHPYTCGGDHLEAVILHVTEGGFHCPVVECGYVQTWCHAFTISNGDMYEDRTGTDTGTVINWQGREYIVREY